MTDIEEKIESEERARAYRVKRKMPVWLEVVITIVVAIVVALIVRLFVFEITRVDGPSMLPTLHTDEQILVNKLSYAFGGQPQRMDVIICKYEGYDSYFVKRVVGLPGESISIKDGELYINGKVIEDNNKLEKITDDFGPVTVPEGHVFVMGDNRNDSMDSRQVGAIPLDDVVGHAMVIVWPLDEIRWLE